LKGAQKYFCPRAQGTLATLLFYTLHKQNIARAWQQENTFLQAFFSVPSGQKFNAAKFSCLPASANRYIYHCAIRPVPTR